MVKVALHVSKQDHRDPVALSTDSCEPWIAMVDTVKSSSHTSANISSLGR